MSFTKQTKMQRKCSLKELNCILVGVGCKTSFFFSLNVLNYFSNDSILKSRRPVYFHSVVTFHHKLFFYTILEWKSSLDIEMYSWIVRKQKDKIQCSVTRILFVFLFYVWISFIPLFITHTIWRSASVCVCV